MSVIYPWKLTPKQAVRLQTQLRDQIRTDCDLKEPQTIAGVDVGYLRSADHSIAAVAVLSYPTLQPLENTVVRGPTPFPYIPGLLSFRETPIILQAMEKLSAPPDLIFVDGHGQAHPRRFRIACHLGAWLHIPTVGIGKTRRCGQFTPPGPKRGDWTEFAVSRRSDWPGAPHSHKCSTNLCLGRIWATSWRLPALDFVGLTAFSPPRAHSSRSHLSLPMLIMKR